MEHYNNFNSGKVKYPSSEVYIVRDYVQDFKNQGFLEITANDFFKKGGWCSSSYSGSDFLYVQELGIEVENAKVKINLPKKGEYRIWVKSGIGKYQILINGTKIKGNFSSKYHFGEWQESGVVFLKESIVIELMKLPGYGACFGSIIISEKQGKAPQKLEGKDFIKKTGESENKEVTKPIAKDKRLSTEELKSFVNRKNSDPKEIYGDWGAL